LPILLGLDPTFVSPGAISASRVRGHRGIFPKSYAKDLRLLRHSAEINRPSLRPLVWAATQPHVLLMIHRLGPIEEDLARCPLATAGGQEGVDDGVLVAEPVLLHDLASSGCIGWASE
jgi:hypothetical protein